MARAETRTLLPLDRWAEIMGLNPVHFNQIQLPDLLPPTVCGAPIVQWAWQQTDQIGREDIAEAIAEAEQTIGEYLQTSLLPQWVVDERMGTVQPAIPDLINVSGRDVQGFRSGIKTRWGNFVSGGIEAKTLVQANATIVYTDEDGDGWDETATIIVPTTVTDAAELAVYYPESDGPLFLPGGAASDAWEIRPLRSVTLAGGTATIVFRRYQCVIPELQEAFQPRAVDGMVDANFLGTVDVYRHWNDPSQQVQLLWSPLGWYGCSCGQVSCAQCTQYAVDGCLSARDYRSGLVTYTPATWNAETQQYDRTGWCVWRNPDRLRLWYRAGMQDNSRRYPAIQMDPSWERAVTYYSIALLDRVMCSCDTMQAVMRHWGEELNLDIATPGSSTTRYQLSRQVLDCPFGQSRGGLYAFNKARNSDDPIGQAVKL